MNKIEDESILNPSKAATCLLYCKVWCVQNKKILIDQDLEKNSDNF